MNQLPLEMRRDWTVICACGERRGRHEWGTERCPNSRWRAGNGQPQWAQDTFLPKYEAQFQRPPQEFA